MFTADGEVVQPAEVLYKKPILVERGSFRPVTKVTLDMLECAGAVRAGTGRAGGESRGANGDDPDESQPNRASTTKISWIALICSVAGQERAHLELRRIPSVGCVPVPLHEKMIGIVMGVPTLRELFEEKAIHRS